MSLFEQTIGFGLVTGGIIAMSATGFSLQYSVTSIPNFMYGEFLTAAAYGTLVIDRTIHSLALSVLIGMAVAGLLAWATDVFVIDRFLRRRSPTIHLLVVTVTLGLAIQALNSMIFGIDPQALNLPASWQVSHSVGPFIFTDIDMAILVIAVVVMAGVHVVLQHTKFGRAQRAIADGRDLAEASGIPVNRVVQATWLIVGMLAGLAGILLAATQGSFDPFLGFNFLLVTLAAAVVGGLGRPYGAMAGALIIGLVTELSGSYLPAEYNQAAALGVLVVVLMFRPNGLVPALRESQLT